MLEGSAIGWFSFDVSGEFYLGGGKPGFERDVGAFVFLSNGRDVDVIAKGFAATFVDDSNGSTDFGIWKRGNVLLKKVDEPAFSLEKGEKLKGSGRVGFFWFFGRRLFRQLDWFGRRLDGGHFANLEDACSEDAVEEDAEEADPGEPEASGDRERGRGGHARRVTRARGMWEFVARSSACENFSRLCRSPRFGVAVSGREEF